MTRTVLAVLAPHLSYLSQIYVRRHFEELHAHAVAVAYQSDDPLYDQWKPTRPLLLLKPARFAQSTHLKAFDRDFGPHTKNIGQVVNFFKRHSVTHILGQGMDFSLPWLEVARERNIPFFVHAHGHDISSGLRQSRYREGYLAYNKASAVIVGSQAGRKRLLSIGIKPNRIRTIPCGVEVPRRFPTLRLNHTQSADPVGPDRIRCLAVGRMVEKKGPLLLLKSFRSALKQNPALTLDYVGDGPLSVQVKQFILENHLEKKITLYGNLPNAQVLRMMNSSDLFLQHSVTDRFTGDEEGLPLVILEAMASGLPVVSTVHSGIPEAVIHGRTGLLSKERDYREMGEQIARLSLDEKTRARFGMEGWKRASRLFTWEEERKSLRALFNSRTPGKYNAD